MFRKLLRGFKLTLVFNVSGKFKLEYWVSVWFYHCFRHSIISSHFLGHFKPILWVITSGSGHQRCSPIYLHLNVTLWLWFKPVLGSGVINYSTENWKSGTDYFTELVIHCDTGSVTCIMIPRQHMIPTHHQQHTPPSYAELHKYIHKPWSDIFCVCTTSKVDG